MCRLVAAALVAGWRTAVAAMVLLPCTIWYLIFVGFEPQHRLFLREPGTWIHIALCGIFLSLSSGGYNTALAFTTIPQAVLFTNVHPLLIIGWRLIHAKMVSPGEIAGVLIGSLGMVLVVESEAGPATVMQVCDRPAVTCFCASAPAPRHAIRHHTNQIALHYIPRSITPCHQNAPWSTPTTTPDEATSRHITRAKIAKPQVRAFAHKVSFRIATL